MLPLRIRPPLRAVCRGVSRADPRPNALGDRLAARSAGFGGDEAAPGTGAAAPGRPTGPRPLSGRGEEPPLREPLPGAPTGRRRRAARGDPRGHPVGGSRQPRTAALPGPPAPARSLARGGDLSPGGTPPERGVAAPAPGAVAGAAGP